jgi:hypothetical protein
MRAARDLARRLADRDARDLGIGLRRHDPGRGRDLVERQIAAGQRLVERRQLTQGLACLGGALGSAVIAACDLRQPLRARRAGRVLLVPVVGLARDHRESLREPRLLCADLQHLTPPRQATSLTRLVDRPLRCTEHAGTFTPKPPAKRGSARPLNPTTLQSKARTATRAPPQTRSAPHLAAPAESLRDHVPTGIDSEWHVPRRTQQEHLGPRGAPQARPRQPLLLPSLSGAPCAATPVPLNPRPESPERS